MLRCVLRVWGLREFNRFADADCGSPHFVLDFAIDGRPGVRVFLGNRPISFRANDKFSGGFLFLGVNKNIINIRFAVSDTNNFCMRTFFSQLRRNAVARQPAEALLIFDGPVDTLIRFSQALCSLVELLITHHSQADPPGSDC